MLSKVHHLMYKDERHNTLLLRCGAVIYNQAKMLSKVHHSASIADVQVRATINTLASNQAL